MHMSAFYCVVSHVLQVRVWTTLQGVIHSMSLQWKGLDKFQNVHVNVDWEKGPKGHHMHSSYYTTLSSKRSLLQAEKRKQN